MEGTASQTAAAWKALTHDARGLSEARLQAHHALQLGTRIARAYLEPKQDDSHTNFGWDMKSGALVGRGVATKQGAIHFALRIADLTTLLVDDSGEATASLPLNGRTLTEASNWVSAEVERHGLKRGRLNDPLHFEILPHPVADHEPFSVDESFAELASYYSNASLVLSAVAAAEPSASEVRCWPHHFDIATLITVSDDRFVNAGLSPGDGSYDRPYFYVSPWQYPQTEDLPELPAGHWHREGWTGAVLAAEQMTETRNPADQFQLAMGFLEAAIAGSRATLVL